jgi:ABC-type phosphate/phosphonate transport system substrate-binding protein
VVRAVLEEKYEAGAVYKGARAQTLSEGQDPDELLPILAESDKIPSEPLVIKKSFLKKNNGLADSILNVLLELGNSSEGQTILDNLGIDRYIPAGNEDYDPVRRVIKTLEEKS